MKFSIDLNLIQDSSINELDCLVYAITDSLSQNGNFRLGLDKFSKLINRNKKAIENSFNRLASAGYIESSIQNGLLQITIVSVQEQLKVMQINQQKIAHSKAKQKKMVATTEEKEIVASVITYLNRKVGKKFRPTGKNQDLVITLLRDGYKEQDFKTVVDNKCADWLNDSYWSKYLRPDTIFNKNKFDGNLNEKHQTAAEVKMKKYNENSGSINGWGK